MILKLIIKKKRQTIILTTIFIFFLGVLLLKDKIEIQFTDQHNSIDNSPLNNIQQDIISFALDKETSKEDSSRQTSTTEITKLNEDKTISNSNLYPQVFEDPRCTGEKISEYRATMNEANSNMSELNQIANSLSQELSSDQAMCDIQTNLFQENCINNGEYPNTECIKRAAYEQLNCYGIAGEKYTKNFNQVEVLQNESIYLFNSAQSNLSYCGL